MTTNHLILDFHMSIVTRRYQRMIEFTGWTVLILRNVIYIVLNVQKKRSERGLNRMELPGIHFLDSGNYHYVTGIMTEQIKQGFSLILFDHHTDMQNR